MRKISVQVLGRGPFFRTKEKTMDIHTSGAQTNDCEIFYVPYKHLGIALAFVLGIAAIFGH